MARPIYSTQFYLGTVFAGTTAVTDLAPGFTYVIREITVNLIIGGLPAPGALFFTLDELAIVSFHIPSSINESLDWSGRVVAPGPASLGIDFIGTAGAATVSVSGYTLTP